MLGVMLKLNVWRGADQHLIPLTPIYLAPSQSRNLTGSIPPTSKTKPVASTSQKNGTRAVTWRIVLFRAWPTTTYITLQGAQRHQSRTAAQRS
jgi:hypothetical protein